MIIILCSWHVNENLIKEIKYDKNVLFIITLLLTIMLEVLL
jgi:hypothetical protein